MALSSVLQAEPVKATPSWVTMVSSGPAWTHGGQSQTFFLTPGIEKHFTDDSSITPFPAFGLFFGYQKLVRDNVDGQLGVELVGKGTPIYPVRFGTMPCLHLTIIAMTTPFLIRILALKGVCLRIQKKPQSKFMQKGGLALR